MEQRSNRLLRALSIAAAVAAAIWLTAMLLTRALSSPQATVYPRLTVPDECALAPIEALASTGLPATSAFAPDGTLHIVITYSRKANEAADQGAQAIWSALDAAATLPATCPLRHLDVTVQSGEIILRAEIAAVDLTAWAAGEIDDQELVERVAYSQQAATPSNR